MAAEDTKANAKDNAKNNKLGGAKGGARYPKDNLEKCVKYAKKLVSKTHNGPQPENVILNGVFGSSTAPGKIRLSSTKQFGFLNGDAKGYSATELAKKINSAPDDELQQFLIEAFFIPKVFKTIYDTFLNDAVNDGKLKQQVLKLDVHPDNAEECVKVFKESIVFAGLGEKLDDDRIQINDKKSIDNGATTDEQGEPDLEEQEDEPEQPVPPAVNPAGKPKGGISNINVNIDVDPSMDPEKLEKLLKLLKTYGAI